MTLIFQMRKPRQKETCLWSHKYSVVESEFKHRFSDSKASQAIF